MQAETMGFDAALSENELDRDEDWIIRIGFLIHDAARLRRIVIDEVFKPLNITRSQAWLMAYLSRVDGTTQSALAEKMGLGNVALGGLIDRLEKSGMIERRADPSDRRINNIYITRTGKKVIKSMRKLTLEANIDILDGISIDEVRKASMTLTKLKRNLEKMRKVLGK